MKAKAGILLLLIGMICFTGFGMTAPDLPQDSKSLVSVDFHTDMVAVVSLNQDYQTYASQAEMEVVTSINDVDLETSQLSNFIYSEKLKRYYHADMNNRCRYANIKNIKKPLYYLNTNTYWQYENFTRSLS